VVVVVVVVVVRAGVCKSQGPSGQCSDASSSAASGRKKEREPWGFLVLGASISVLVDTNLG